MVKKDDIKETTNSVSIYSYLAKLKIKSVAYSYQVCHTGQLNLCNWLADGSTTG